MTKIPTVLFLNGRMPGVSLNFLWPGRFHPLYWGQKVKYVDPLGNLFCLTGLFLPLQRLGFICLSWRHTCSFQGSAGSEILCPISPAARILPASYGPCPSGQWFPEAAKHSTVYQETCLNLSFRSCCPTQAILRGLPERSSWKELIGSVGVGLWIWFISKIVPKYWGKQAYFSPVRAVPPYRG